MKLIGAAAIPGLVCAAVLWALLRGGKLALDVPNERSLHSAPVPRVGGIGIALGVAAAAVTGLAPVSLALLLALALAMLSFLDDVKRLPTSMRLAAHLWAAAVLVWYTLSPMNVLEMALLVIAVAWITNLYNFMDGSDGLAGGMAVVGFSAYAIAAWLAGDADVAQPSAALVGASAAFLAFNFHPARVFLGDVGSIPLGFLAAALGVVGWRDDVWQLWCPVLVFGPFIGDATLTLLKRLARREKVWHAHREHYYQRLVLMGAGHRATALAAYALMALCAAAALYGRTQPPGGQAIAFGATTVVLVGVALGIDVCWSRYLRSKAPT